MFPSPFARLFGIKSAPFDNEQYRNQEGKATEKRNCYQKVIICFASLFSLTIAAQFLRCRRGRFFQRCKMEYDDSIVRQMVECIKVYPGGKLEIIFGGGYLVEESV